MRALIFCLLFYPLSASPSEFMGGTGSLIDEAKEWAANTLEVPIDQVEITPPDGTIPIKPCDKQLRFKFLFPGNNKTLEVVCLSPAWKRFLSMKVTDTFRGWIFSRDLKAGTKLESSDVSVRTGRQPRSDRNIDLESIVGMTLNRDVIQGDEVTVDLLGLSFLQYRTKRSYEAGEPINPNDLDTQTNFGSESPPTSIQWAKEPMVATRYLPKQHLLSPSDVEASRYVIVARQVIVNGQVITPDMVERRLESASTIGETSLKDIDEVLGLEATRTLRAGQKIVASDLIAADLIRKNENVRLTISKGSLTITVETTALENAKMGEQVLLRNMDSGKEIRGIVTGRNEARGL